MRSKYAPLAYAARALRLLPYVSFDQEGEHFLLLKKKQINRKKLRSYEVKQNLQGV